MFSKINKTESSLSLIDQIIKFGGWAMSLLGVSGVGFLAYIEQIPKSVIIVLLVFLIACSLHIFFLIRDKKANARSFEFSIKKINQDKKINLELEKRKICQKKEI